MLSKAVIARSSLRFLIVFVAVLIATPVAAPGRALGGDILDTIRAVPGVLDAAEATSNIPGTRFFRVNFEQLVDHDNPTGPTFVQRLTILHRDTNRPVVLEISGYYVAQTPTQYEPTALLQANQIHVEHRFFVPSRPSPVDWQFLDVAQAAADHHEIFKAFKTIYPAKWLSTGASKGGMATVYNRYFYPDDIDASVAYVAPSSHGTQDSRYVPFVAGLGSTKCQKRLLNFQKRALKKRAKLERYMTGSYDILGKDRALEFAILEMPFIFWQYGSADFCDDIPGSGASPRQLFDFLDGIVGITSYGDDVLTAFEPYYYQSATQLGGPAVGEAGLESLLRYSGEDAPDILPPIGIPKTFDPAIMPVVEDFVSSRATRILFIYGANDPWSTNAFEPATANDAYRYFVTGVNGNHGSQILELSPADRDAALAKLSEWIGVSIPTPKTAVFRIDPQYRIDRHTRQELFLR